jgi:hypothetical protein
MGRRLRRHRGRGLPFEFIRQPRIVKRPVTADVVDQTVLDEIVDNPDHQPVAGAEPHAASTDRVVITHHHGFGNPAHHLFCQL